MAIRQQSITSGASLWSLPVRGSHLMGRNTHDLGPEPSLGVEQSAKHLGVPVQTRYGRTVARSGRLCRRMAPPHLDR